MRSSLNGRVTRSAAYDWGATRLAAVGVTSRAMFVMILHAVQERNYEERLIALETMRNAAETAQGEPVADEPKQCGNADFDAQIAALSDMVKAVVSGVVARVQSAMATPSAEPSSGLKPPRIADCAEGVKAAREGASGEFALNRRRSKSGAYFVPPGG